MTRHSDIHVKKLLAVAALSFGLAGAGIAGAGDRHGHERPDGPPPVGKMVERLKEDLKLTDGQSVQVTKILEQERAAHEAARKDAQTALEKVLDKEQLQQLEARRKHGPDDHDDDRDDHHGDHKGRGGDSRR